MLARDAEAAARDGDAAARRKAETLANRAQLEAQMGLQAEETAWMDRHFAEEQEREWARRQAKWDAEAAARRALQADVATVRGHQVQDRIRARAEEEARDAAQVAVWREQQAAAAAREAAAAAERRRAAELQKSYTAKQLAENEAARAAAAQAAYLESRLADKVERDYHARVEALLKVGERAGVGGGLVGWRLCVDGGIRTHLVHHRNPCPRAPCMRARGQDCGEASIKAPTASVFA